VSRGFSGYHRSPQFALDDGLRTSKQRIVPRHSFWGGAKGFQITFPRTTITCGQVARAGSAAGLVRRVLLDVAPIGSGSGGSAFSAIFLHRGWEILGGLMLMVRGAGLTGLKIFHRNTLQTVSATMNGEVLTAPT